MTFTRAGTADIHADSMQSKAAPWIFCGGDLTGNGTTVEATNDGKTASWYLHKYIQNAHGLTVADKVYYLLCNLPNICIATIT